MRILYLSPRESWPTNSGAKLRDYHLARGLAQAAEVRYLFFGGAAAASELKGTHVPTPAKYTASKIFRGVIGPQPLPILNYTSDEMAAAISALASDVFDVVHLDSIHMAGYLPELRKLWPRATVILDWHNIESEAMRRFANSSSSRLKRAYARYTAAGLQRVEDRMLAQLQGHLVCSERERNMLLRRNPAARIAVIDNGVDSTRFTASHNPRSTRVIFVGQMSYGPNAEGAVWFVNDIWPALRQQFPKLTLSIVGADPGPAVQVLASRDGVTVTGTVPDVRSYYDGAFAAVVPLRSGAGTRLKILEAMAAEVPVISTALGAEGLAVTDGVNLLLAEDPSSWLVAFHRISDETQARALTSAARQLVVDRYDWSILGKKLVETYRDWTSATSGKA